MEQLIITKASGEKAKFSIAKLQLSLRRSGADEVMIREVLRLLEPYLYEGISTKQIYKHAFDILKRMSKTTAARYSLKHGIMQLGPTGFPFEKFIAELLKVQGYATQIGVFMDGRCIRHEIDVIAAKDGKRYMIECKYHNLSGVKSDVKIPMYILSRFKDVEKVRVSEHEYEVRFHQGWVVTNTRFTDDAIRFATCMNLHLIGWDYPDKGGIKDLVNSSDLYPLTCLTTLSQSEKQKLLDMKYVLCKELLHNTTALLKAGVKENHITSVLTEVQGLCGS
ncbi:restriction endonuclease [Pontibacter sp. KCTC 32443]|uniref:restriction endonuclease n=1 Tax=Pontibacter TaxID=323449 RepID=UPI00164E9FEE|nr:MULTISPECIES: restriction endonuclease [Pontibacter]MBC5772722.1 restriction endonuclease [Pontibacter sp. KCTC 32443]